MSYQIKCQCGYQIVVLQSGEDGLCVLEKEGREVETGPHYETRRKYDELVKWLNARGIQTLAQASRSASDVPA